MKKKNNPRWLFPCGMALLLVLLAISGLIILNRIRDTKASAEVLETEREAVTVSDSAQSAETSESAGAENLEKPPISVDFKTLQEINPDVKAWLYCEDTTINFAILQSDNNWYYLSYLADGTRNEYGSVFMDYRCSDDFSDSNTIFYGHDMQNGTMFGGLELYREQDYYEKHSVMYLLTPEKNYRLDAVCGYLHTMDTALYDLPATADTTDNTVWTGIARSTFDSLIIPEDGDRFVTLSTCADDYDGARYALILRMTEIG